VRAGPYTGEVVEIVGEGVFIKDAGDGLVHGAPRGAVERVKRRGGKRVENGLTDTGGALDDCQTPDLVALAICLQLARDGADPLLVIEPSAGEGAFVRAAKATWPDAAVIAVEVRAEAEEALHAAGADAVLIGRWEDQAAPLREFIEATGTGRTLIVGNPPYRLAVEHALLALEPVGGSRPSLAFLLTLGFITTAARLRDFWGWEKGDQGRSQRTSALPWNGLAVIHPLAERPHFMEKQGGGKKTDMREYGVFSWSDVAADYPTVIGAPIWWKPAKAGAEPGDEVDE
jgi:hypothetical protein